ncbi:hypothetical protein [Cytophaga aurantiaca]|uniref:hypothetical protein n=1 Tax=Cytophaga aurantiaca TaxID=29530 RepID=UPI00035E839C|nr:hypothetical protein [Cytophaga aurantiaca]
MRYTILILAFITNIHFVSGQDFIYPAIKPKAKNIKDFIPTDWNVVDTVSGDLNKDTFKDVAFVIENRNNKNLKPEQFQHFILVIAFFDSIQNQFKLIEQCNNLILYNQYQTSAWYEGMQIVNGILEISFYKGGSTDNLTNYKFRYKENDFYLIGADRNIYNQVTKKFQNYSFNFLSKKWSVSTGNDESSAEPKTEWGKLENTIMTLKNYKGPYSWEVSKGIYL